MPTKPVPQSTPTPILKSLSLADFDRKSTASSTSVAPKYLPPVTALKPMTKDKKAYLDAKNKPEPNAFLDNIVRDKLPLPKNAAGVVMKKVLNRSRMNTASLSSAEKGVMAKVALNAYKRTGKLSGGTEYEDYAHTTNDLAYQQIVGNVKKGNINPILGTAIGAYDPAYRMATTVGRGTYSIDPDNHNNIVFTDQYDFTNNMTQDSKGKLKSGYLQQKTGDVAVDAYRGIRRNLAIADQSVNNPENYRTKFTLKASDTLNLGNNRYNPPVKKAELSSSVLTKLRGLVKKKP